MTEGTVEEKTNIYTEIEKFVISALKDPETKKSPEMVTAIAELLKSSSIY